MNGVQTRLKCKPNVKRCKRFVFAAHSPLLHPNTLKTKAIIHFQTDHILTRFVFPPLYDRLIEAWIKVNRKHPDWHIRIYGEGQDRNSLQELIEKHHIENSFSLCPPTKSIQEKYLESSIYVMSSRFEGLPMALLEAMACGVPCISFDCPYGPAEIITPEEDGILVKNGNTDELADAICRLIEDTDKRIRMGKQAQKNIQRYSREEVMKLWDELFNTLTTARP